jgi:GNAT superfamily N-acetyltransferase
MTEISIREAKESDLPAIEKLSLELIDSLYSKVEIDKEKILKNCKKLFSDVNSYLLVAEMNESVVGFIHFITRTTLLHYKLSGLVDELVVARDYKKKGVGKALIHAAAEQCRQLGCCELEVSTEFSNTAARDFYKGCGFSERGVILEQELL